MGVSCGRVSELEQLGVTLGQSEQATGQRDTVHQCAQSGQLADQKQGFVPERACTGCINTASVLSTAGTTRLIRIARDRP